MQARRQKGQALIETAVAGIFLIPIVLFLIDVGIMVLCNMTNDECAKNAARAAANQPQSTAKQAADIVINNFKTNQVITQLQIKNFDYPQSKDAVTVQTEMHVQLPVPFPGFSALIFEAKSIQPIVSQ